MKNKILSLLMISLFVLFCSPVYAEDTTKNHVTDKANLISNEEVSQLNEMARKVSEEQNCGVYILILDNFRTYVDTGDIAAAAQSLYESSSMGYGEDKSGILLMLSTNERNYTLLAHGYGNTAFTDYGKDYLSERFLDDFKHDDWYAGFYDYISTSEEMLSLAKQGKPVDVNSVPVSAFARIYGVIACSTISLLLTFLIIYLMKRQHQSVAEQKNADHYHSKDQVKMGRTYDRYLRTTQTRVYEAPPSSNNSGSSGGGTTVNSGGYSSKSGSY